MLKHEVGDSVKYKPDSGDEHFCEENPFLAGTVVALLPEDKVRLAVFDTDGSLFVVEAQVNQATEDEEAHCAQPQQAQETEKPKRSHKKGKKGKHADQDEGRQPGTEDITKEQDIGGHENPDADVFKS